MRNLLIKCAKELTSKINSDKKIEPLLFKKPYPMENIEVVIFNYDSLGNIVCDPLITVADISKGVLRYRTNDPDNMLKYKHCYQETYEEALEKISSAHEKINDLNNKNSL